MKIIVEGGATKTDWCSIAENGEIRTLKTDGMNLAVMPADKIDEMTNKAISVLNVDNESVSEMHFYVAGLVCDRGNGSVEYASDLLGAARAVCGREPGIAVILGTGSNSCFYDGQDIVKNVRSGGYILGDEGGAACLGKMFVSDFLKNLVPQSIADQFAKDFVVDYPTVVKNVYKGDSPSKYLGSFAPWILERYDTDEYVKNLVDFNFSNFIERALKQYELDKYPVGVVGGFAFACKEILERVAAGYGIKLSKIIESPMQGLIEYHSK